MLSASELADFRCSGDTFPVGSDAAPSVFGPPAKLSQVFLQRLFEEVLCCFVLAIRHLKEKIPY